MPKELDPLRKGLIVVQSIDDNEFFKWCLIRYLNPVAHNPRRFTKADKDFAKRLDFKDIKFPVKIKRITKADKNFAKRRDFKDIKFPVKIRDIHKIEKRSSIGISVFGDENKVKYPTYIKKCCEDKHVDLLLISEGEKKHYVLLKNFNTFMDNHTLLRGKKIVIICKVLEQ